jgi:type VI secretion system protein ImpK
MNLPAAQPYPTHQAAATPSWQPTVTLLELLEDGTTLVTLLRGGIAPKEIDAFAGRVGSFLANFERQAQAYGKIPGLVSEAKYAFCALFDEVVLSTGGEFAERWSGAPLQLQHFGEHLAGEGFFNHLDHLRLDPVQNLEVMEVYYTCLLLGFKGKYLLESPELLNLLISRLRQEILQAKGGQAAFAPHARPPQRFNEFIRHDLPLWIYFIGLLVVSVLIFLGFWLFLGYRAGQIGG